MSSSITLAASGIPASDTLRRLYPISPGRPVTPAQHLPADHDGCRQPGAEVDIDGRVVTGQRPPARFCLGRRLRVGGHPDRRPGEGVPQLAAERKLAPAVDGRGEFYPVVERDAEGGYAHGRQFAAGSLGREKVTGCLDTTLEAGACALSPPLETVADASCSPSGAHTAMAILVPPKSRPSTTGGSAT